MQRAISRRKFGEAVGGALGAFSLGGCGVWDEPFAPLTARFGAGSDLPEGDPVWRVLNRLAYGPRPGDVERVREMGVEAYFDEQLAPESIVEDPALERRLVALETLDLDAEGARECEREWAHDTLVLQVLVNKLAQFPLLPGQVGLGRTATELQQACVLRATYSRRQLQEVMVEFWTDHFNIDQRKGDCQWLKTIDDRQIRQHALGKFRDLVAASAHSPAMLFYLDNSENRRRNAADGAAPNENYARELLELHTLGVHGGYTLHDIQEVARCLTGWGLKSEWELHPGEFTFRPDLHDDGTKTVLGHVLPAGQGQADGEQVIDIVCRHPSTASFIAEKLCRRFVADVAPADLVASLAKVFLKTDGDIRKILSALFHSPQFLYGDGRKLKRPFDFTISALRALDAETTGKGLLPYLDSMGQLPFSWPLPDGYPDHADAWAHTLKARWGLAVDLLQGQIPETTVPALNLAAAVGDHQPLALGRGLSRLVLGRALSETQLRTLVMRTGDRQLAEVVPQWLALFLSAPEIQWR